MIIVGYQCYGCSVMNRKENKRKEKDRYSILSWAEFAHRAPHTCVRSGVLSFKTEKWKQLQIFLARHRQFPVAEVTGGRYPWLPLTEATR